jgi:hypothetical protein
MFQILHSQIYNFKYREKYFLLTRNIQRTFEINKLFSKVTYFAGLDELIRIC